MAVTNRELLDRVEQRREKLLAAHTKPYTLGLAIASLVGGIVGVGVGVFPALSLIAVPAIAYASISSALEASQPDRNKTESEIDSRLAYLNLISASISGNAELVKEILDVFDPSKEEIGEALSYASLKNHVSVVKILLAAGARPDYKDSKPFKWARAGGAEEALAEMSALQEREAVDIFKGDDEAVCIRHFSVYA